jgi:hypothetical protein
MVCAVDTVTRDIVLKKLQELGEFKGGLKLVALSLFLTVSPLNNIFIVTKKRNLILR